MLEHGLRPFGVGLGLIADGLEAVDAVLERRVVQIGDARLDGVIEPFEPQFRFRRAFVEFGDMLAAALGMFLPPIENGGKDGFQPRVLEKLAFKMVGDQIVQLVHRDRHAGAGCRSLPRLDRAGIVAIAPALAGADGHGPAALGAMDQAGEQGRAADDARGHDLGIAGLEQLLHGVEGFAVDQRRDGDRYDFADRLQFLGLGPLVELMLAHIGLAGEDAVDLTDAPTPAVAGEDAVAVEVADDVLHAHLAGRAVAFQRQPVDQAHGVGVQRVDLQLFLGFRAALLGGDGTIADGRQRAVPEALPRILLQGADDVLGVLLRLILVEQGHDLPHHDVHGIVAHLLRDGDEPDAVLRQPPDVELKFEVIAEEAAERVDHNHVERRGPGRARLDHALELRPAVVGRRRAGFDESLDELVAA